MIRTALVATCLSLVSCAAEPQLPDIPPGVPYAEARAQMIDAGFLPQRFSQRISVFQDAPMPADWCPAEDARTCAAFPEVMTCSNGMLQRCQWLYRAGEAGRFALVATRCTDFDHRDCFEKVEWAAMEDWEGFVIAGPVRSAPP